MEIRELFADAHELPIGVYSKLEDRVPRVARLGAASATLRGELRGRGSLPLVARAGQELPPLRQAPPGHASTRHAIGYRAFSRRAPDGRGCLGDRAAVPLSSGDTP